MWTSKIEHRSKVSNICLHGRQESGLFEVAIESHSGVVGADAAGGLLAWGVFESCNLSSLYRCRRLLGLDLVEICVQVVFDLLIIRALVGRPGSYTRHDTALSRWDGAL
jgi:hypothetical protein